MLILVNLVDFIGGCSLISFGVYVYVKKYGPEYVYGPLTAIGTFILLTMLFSVLGSLCPTSCCSCCLYPLSAFMGLLLSLGEIIAGALLLAYKDKYDDWLDNNHQQYHISDDESKKLKDGVTTVAAAFFILAFIEVLRFCSSRGYTYGKQQDEEEKRMLDDYEEYEYRVMRASRQMERQNKHAQLRKHYADKYKL
eukprot:CAMPEP_0167749324 /NCGR_PEP_ID=MMETSP0110_2-20121227/5341_1 /TAXON_ID=629695 /ORGANISM="Gymnochlora sp., Strain CCMP2014" /LENGTH=194 /DNA_ID=CAMNT_0007634459 /DNA_START=124 /DNA_END=708 /DNA_ORIENTATION=-